VESSAFMKNYLNSSFIPTFGLLADLLQRKKYAPIQQNEERGFVGQWFLLYGSASKESLLNPQPAALKKLFPPNDRIWADPFLWKKGDDFFIFCEEWMYNRPHGHIAVMQLAKDGCVSPSEPVLIKGHHLSYPFLFEYEGILHMMPEGGAGRAIEVYACEEFPNRWRKRATLMQDIEYADATLLEYQSKWWLFVTIKRGLHRLNRDLFVFWADTPFSDKWTPHPLNPVVQGLKRARPAGPFFELNGKLFRPSQNSLVRYGHSLRINEVLNLDVKHYQERLVTEVRPDWAAGVRSTHHINWLDGMLVMDARRMLPVADVFS
jgi:hypothetical protein